MPDFAMLDADDNELTAGSFEEVPPGGSYSALYGGPLVLKVKNTAGVAKTNRKLVAAERQPFLVHQWVRLSLDGITFVSSEIELGSFTATESKTVYFDLIVPGGAPGGNNQRCDLRIVPFNG